MVRIAVVILRRCSTVYYNPDRFDRFELILFSSHPKLCPHCPKEVVCPSDRAQLGVSTCTLALQAKPIPSTGSGHV